jgi:hypothetical protein
MNIFEIDISYINNNYSSIETFLAGAVQAFSFAIPLSVPLLICLRRLLVEGIPAGIVSYLGNSVGQTFFLFMVLGGFRDAIQIWYDWEPVLYIAGLFLTLKVLFTFYLESRLKRPTLVDPKTLAGFFGIQVLLVMGNPVNAINLSGFVTNNELLGMEGSLTLYLLGFFLSLCGCSTLFGLGFYLARNWFLVVSVKPYSLFMKPVNRGLVIFSLTLMFTATSKMAWELFTYHPVENIVQADSFLGTKAKQPLRRFNPLDFGIRSQNRPIPVATHFPLKVLIQRRVWMNKPPLTNSQEEQVYFRYNIHIVNRFAEWMRQLSFANRTPFTEKNTPEQIRRLQQVKTDYVALHSMIQEGKEKSLKYVPNGWKGKPPTSYTQEKVDSSASSSRLYLHSDLISESEKEIYTPKVDFGSFHQPFRFTSEGKYTNAPLIEKISPPL